MRDQLFDAQGDAEGFSPKSVERYAAKAGLDVAAFKSALDRYEHEPDVLSDAAAAEAARINVSPVFVICGDTSCDVGGYYLVGAPPVRSFEKLIARALADFEREAPRP